MERRPLITRSTVAHRLTRGVSATLSAALLCFGGALPGSAQQPRPTLERPEAMNLEWWHPVAAGAGVATIIFVIDQPLQEWIQPGSESLDGVADFAARFKDPEVFWTAGLGSMAVGLAAGQPKVTATGAQILAAYGIAGWINIGTKWAFGRTRPSQTLDDATDFSWFDGGSSSSFSSGSAAVVFSLATTVADAVDRRPVSIVLYTAAGLNSWSRVHTNRHWLSDVVLGGIYGVTAAKLVNGRWTVFGLRPPTFWTDGRRSGLGYSIRF